MSSYLSNLNILVLFLSRLIKNRNCVFSAIYWKIPDIAFLGVSFHNPTGNWTVSAITYWINHFYFVLQNNLLDQSFLFCFSRQCWSECPAKQKSNQYGHDLWFTAQTSYLFTQTWWRHIIMFLKPRACKLWRRK